VLTTDGGATPSIEAFRIILALIAVIALASVPVAAAIHRFVASAESAETTP
jgi:hypothetical protein